MSSIDVLAVMDSEYWAVYGRLHSLCEAANHDERHGQVSTKHVLACLDGTGEAIDAADEARSAVAGLIEAAALVAEYDPTFLELRAALTRCRGGDTWLK